MHFFRTGTHRWTFIYTNIMAEKFKGLDQSRSAKES